MPSLKQTKYLIYGFFIASLVGGALIAFSGTPTWAKIVGIALMLYGTVVYRNYALAQKQMKQKQEREERRKSRRYK